MNKQTATQPKQVRKAVIAAAGFGTRFLPQTKAMPKEMLPLIDKPIIQYIVEELVDAGIEDIIIVTGYHKRTIEDHFDAPNADLIQNLQQGGKDELLELTESVSNMANFAYVRQKGPYGNATPLLCVEHLIGDEPFLYTFADDFVVSQPVSRFRQLVDIYQSEGGSVLTCIEADGPEDYKRYGYVSGTPISDNLFQTAQIVEKPGSRDAAPSSLASVGGYLMEPEIYSYLHEDLANLQEGSEFIFQPAIQRMINDGYTIHALKIDGTYYDAGNKLEYIKTVIDFALKRDDIKDELIDYLRSRIK